MLDSTILLKADQAWSDWGRDGALSQLSENLSEDAADSLLDDADYFLESLGIDPEEFECALCLYTPWVFSNDEIHFDSPDSGELLRAYPELNNALPSH